jgi:hypothetical protein
MVPSNKSNQESIADQFEVANGDAQSGDTFLLLTDAIAAWYLRMFEERPQRAIEMELLLRANDNAGAIELISTERDFKRLRNDDIAVVRILVRSAESVGAVVATG